MIQMLTERGVPVIRPEPMTERLAAWKGGAPLRLAPMEVVHATIRRRPVAFERVWRRQSAAAVARAAAAFRGADRVVTSRLHGHILACLLGVPHVLRDNSYGKNSRYFHAWSSDLSFARMEEGDAAG